MRLKIPKRFNVPGVEEGDSEQKSFRPRLLRLAFAAGFVALIVLLAASFLRPAPLPDAPTQAPTVVSNDPPAEIPAPAPLPDLNSRPPAKPLDVYLAGDPFPRPPAPAPTPSAPPAPRASAPPRIPPPNPVALFASANELRFIGYVGGERQVGTFAIGGKYLVMGPGDAFPGSAVRIVSLSPSKAVLSDGRYRHAIERQ